MKKFLQTFKDIWSIPELKNKILLTLGLLLVHRLGTYVVLPGVNPNGLADLARQSQSGPLSLLNNFTGGAFGNASIFALGIMPYISASIGIQLMSLAIPYFQKLQKEGESGRRQLNQYTRYLTILFTAVQAVVFVKNLVDQSSNAILVSNTVIFYIMSVSVLVAGTMFCMWLGEKITDKGIGNGISLLIMVGIISKLPQSFANEMMSKVNNGEFFTLVIELFIWIIIVAFTIMLIQGVRRVPVQYAKRNLLQGGKVTEAGGARQFIPLKINAAGVMPVIFAQALMFVPSFISQLSPKLAQNDWLIKLQQPNSWLYNGVIFILIVIFTYFYTAIIINPTQMAEDIKRGGGYIPSVKPGTETADFIDTVMSRITFPGALYLGLIAIIPGIVFAIGLVNQDFSIFYGGTSLLILVGVVLDTLQQIDSHLLMKKYDGLTQGAGRLKGRNLDANMNVETM